MSNSFILTLQKFLQELQLESIEFLDSNKVMVKNKSHEACFQLLPYATHLKNTNSSSFSNSSIDIYEDQWNSSKNCIISRVKSKLGLNKTLAGRACKIVSLSNPIANEFFQLNHLQGSSSSGFRYGLLFKEELVAAIAFSKSRIMVDSAVYYRSYELIKFANKNGITVMGGLDKLLKHFIKEKHAQHIMTYIDLEWGEGTSFLKLGFNEIGYKEGIPFYINPKTHTRYSQREFELLPTNSSCLLLCKNKGSKKLVLDLR